MASGPQPARRDLRKGVAIVVVLLVAVLVLLVLRRGDDGGGTDGAEPTTDLPVRTGLDGVGIVVYGDSWSTPGPWHAAGRHWSQLLDSNTDMGIMVNLGVAGSTMEDAANLVTGSGRGAWEVTPEEPVVTIVMTLLNGVVLPSSDPATLDASLESLRAAALTVGERVLTDAYAEDDEHARLEGDWTPTEGEPFAGGSIQHATTGSVTFTVPDDVDGRMLWLSTLAGAESVAYDVAVDGDAPARVDTPVTEHPDPGYTKWFLPVGEVDAGQEVTVTNVTGEFWFDGMYLDSGRGMVAFATERSDLRSSFFPEYNDTARVEAHNEVLREVVDELNDLLPDSAALIDLAEASGWNNTTMAFREDEIHPDDTGQEWIFEIVAACLRDIIEDAPRLDA